MQPRIYLDHNATTPLVDAARAAMTEALTVAGNPSSVHRDGRRARHLVEVARDQVARLLGAGRDEVVFTSGGTEADWLGIRGLASADAARLVGCAQIEHPAVLGAARSADRSTPRWLRVDPVGRIDVADVAAAIAAGRGDEVVAIGGVNHELGVVQDLEAIASIVRTVDGVRLHVDAVQLAGKRPLAPVLAVADTVAISAHKLGGPPGVGALWIRAGTAFQSPFHAGHQEKGRRPGTENVVGIVGFGAAAAAVDPSVWSAVTALGDRLEAGLIALGARIHGAGAPRIGGTINAGFPAVLGESVVIALDLAGVSVSTGAACTSGTVAPSPVLLALGVPDAEARQAVRFSLGRSNTVAEIDRVLELLPGILDRARR
jgi:cysteine desulfurase